MSNYAINVKCVKCGTWAVVVDPDDSFNEREFICDECEQRKLEAELRVLRALEKFVRENHPKIYKRFLTTTQGV